MARILGTYGPHSVEWHAARRWRLGGSEIAQACGWSPHGTRDQLIARKLAGTITDPTAAQERGTYLEPSVLAWAAHRLGVDLDRQASDTTYLHDQHDWASYNPDGITTSGDLLLEIKTTADRSTDRGWGRAGTAQIPLHYACQLEWGLGILGLDRAVLAVLHGATNGRPDLGLAVYRYTARPDRFAALIQRGSAFITDLTDAREAAA